MRERYSLPLTKREAKQLFTYLLQAEKDGGKTKEYWSRHEKLAEKLQVIIYECKEPHYKPLTLRSGKSLRLTENFNRSYNVSTRLTGKEISNPVIKPVDV